ncbi:nucleotidyltransferase family protein [Prauserella oleivorans]|uniref:Nucleotidyltransferase family protein n=1 Tax=Prauserella oleivorans TaxID=1478153 RepID=A0ABW5WAD5_9PSEU
MEVDQEQLLRTVTRVVTTLREADVPFALAGGCAVYARGGPASDHDVDIFVTEADAPVARKALIAAGMRAADPPEDWLVKVYDGDCLVDVIFRPNQRPVTADLLARCEEMRVGPTSAPVLPATDVMVDKLLVLGPHRCDFTPLLPIARALREQVDWHRAARETAGSPYARAFLRLLTDLGVKGGDSDAEPG